MSTLLRSLRRSVLGLAALCLPLMLLATLLAALAGCSASSPTSGSSTGSIGRVQAPLPEGEATAGDPAVRWVCDGGTSVLVEQAGDESALVVWDGEERPLVRLPAASGARYGDGTLELWTRGDEALLEVEGEARRSCRRVEEGALESMPSDPLRAPEPVEPSEPLELSEPMEPGPFHPAPWDRARAAGVDLRAVGQEPGWILQVWDGERLVLEADYGERLVELPYTGRKDLDGGFVLTAEGDGQRLEALWVEEPCADTMSGERFDHAVTVTLGEDSYRGCGRLLP